MAVFRDAVERGRRGVMTPDHTHPRITWVVVAASGCLFLATTFIRYLSLTGLSNDHYQYLAGAQQMLMGELPTRDFLDPGQPLMYAMSAGAQLVFGRTLLAEALMTSLAFGLAAACVAIAGWQVSRSVWVGVIASIVSVLAFPRPYGYPKALLYAVVPLAIWAWVRSPAHRRLVVPALLVAIACLFRHDHGLYLGAAAVAAILLTPPMDRRTRLVRVSVFGGLVLLALMPYLVFVQSHQGLWQYAVSSLTSSSREAERTQLHFALIERGTQAWLYYGVQVLALVAAACVWLGYRRGSTDVPIAAPLVVSAVLVNWNFLRDPLGARFPDRQLAEIPIDEERSVRILVHAGLPPSRVDQTTGWPCFTRHDGGT